MESSQVYRASVTAPVNIAVVKYWGKRDTKLNLPTNSSISVTLSQDDLRAHTTSTCSPKYETDRLFLGGVPQDLTAPRTAACLSALRLHRRAMEDVDSSLKPLSKYPLLIASENNFPTAAGLASSAAGFAALVYAVAKLYQLPLNMVELSRMARQGSGSACRSLFGGYVAWNMGARSDGVDSEAVPVLPQADWPTMRALILVANAGPKAIGSSAGMQMTVATSTLFRERAEKVVPERMQLMEEAIKRRDWLTFADQTMRDSNSFHATCLDTFPPIMYLNDTSRAIMMLVHHLNTKEVIAAYTCDAGPNVVIYFEEERREAVMGAFADVFRGSRLAGHRALQGTRPQPLDASVSSLKAVIASGVTDLIATQVGDGPRIVEDHLIDQAGNLADK